MVIEEIKLKKYTYAFYFVYRSGIPRLHVFVQSLLKIAASAAELSVPLVPMRNPLLLLNILVCHSIGKKIALLGEIFELSFLDCECVLTYE